MINRYPIIVFHTPRVGSTALGLYLKNLSGPDTPYFSEPDLWREKGLSKFLKSFYENKKMVIKINVEHLPRYSMLLDYLMNDPEPYRIRVKRRDLVKQAVSAYITYKNNVKNGEFIWNFSSTPLLSNEIPNRTDDMPCVEVASPEKIGNRNSELMINEYGLKEAIRLIIQQTAAIERMSIKFDEDLYYEDIIPYLKTTKIIEYPKPSNYSVILKTAYDIYERMKSQIVSDGITMQ